MLTPSQISVKSSVAPITVPDYNFEDQNRWDGISMMSTTTNTRQTFDNNGNACDSTNDED